MNPVKGPIHYNKRYHKTRIISLYIFLMQGWKKTLFSATELNSNNTLSNFTPQYVVCKINSWNSYWYLWLRLTWSPWIRPCLWESSRSACRRFITSSFFKMASRSSRRSCEEESFDMRIRVSDSCMEPNTCSTVSSRKRTLSSCWRWESEKWDFEKVQSGIEICTHSIIVYFSPWPMMCRTNGDFDNFHA